MNIFLENQQDIQPIEKFLQDQPYIALIIGSIILVFGFIIVFCGNKK